MKKQLNKNSWKILIKNFLFFCYKIFLKNVLKKCLKNSCEDIKGKILKQNIFLKKNFWRHCKKKIVKVKFLKKSSSTKCFQNEWFLLRMRIVATSSFRSVLVHTQSWNVAADELQNDFGILVSSFCCRQSHSPTESQSVSTHFLYLCV